MVDEPRRWPALDLSHPLIVEHADRLAELAHEVGAHGIDEHPRGDQTWRLHFGDRAARSAAARQLRGILQPRGFTVAEVDVPDEGWAARSQAGLAPVRVGALTIAPPWAVERGRANLEPGSRPDPARVIVIEPSTGFGTGHHASTRLCLLALQDLRLTGRDVLDVGTGSGVLALAARRLGSARVTAIDADPDALAAARANVARDSTSGRIDVALVDIERPGNDGAGDAPHPRDRGDRTLRQADVVLANLTGALLARVAVRLMQLTRPGGFLIVGGFTIDEEPAVRAAFAPLASSASRYREDDWVALRLGPREAPAAGSASEIAPGEL